MDGRAVADGCRQPGRLAVDEEPDVGADDGARVAEPVAHAGPPAIEVLEDLADRRSPECHATLAVGVERGEWAGDDDVSHGGRLGVRAPQPSTTAVSTDRIDGSSSAIRRQLRPSSALA